MNLKQDDTIELTAEKLIYSGVSLSHYEGKAVFIENAVPGDILKTRIVKINKSFIRAKILEIITPSKHRVKPFCPLFNACGGCNLQNFGYDFLTSQKQGILEEIFSASANDCFKNIEFKPFIKAENIQHEIKHKNLKAWDLPGFY